MLFRSLDGVDNDCDWRVDEGTTAFDDDGDGWTEGDGDCDDTDAFTFPVAPEAADGEDDDCDGVIDEGTVLFDDDGDGWSELDGDCDDGDAHTFLGAPERIDGRDGDCDSVAEAVEGWGCATAPGSPVFGLLALLLVAGRRLG